MDSQNPASDRPTVTEGLATTALFLNLMAVMASAICLGGFALGQSVFAITMGGVALLTFSTSMVCFAMDSRIREARDRVPAAEAVSEVVSRPAI